MQGPAFGTIRLGCCLSEACQLSLRHQAGWEGHLSYFSLSPGAVRPGSECLCPNSPTVKYPTCRKSSDTPCVLHSAKGDTGTGLPRTQLLHGSPAQHRPGLKGVSSHREDLGSTAPHLLCYPGGSLAPFSPAVPSRWKLCPCDQ